MIEFFRIFGFGVLGIFLYAGFTVYKKASREGFNGRKFFNDNWLFWLVCIGLHILIAITAIVQPDALKALEFIGFAVDDPETCAWVIFGISLAMGGDKTKITGMKTLSRKIGGNP